MNSNPVAILDGLQLTTLNRPSCLDILRINLIRQVHDIAMHEMLNVGDATGKK